jgi:hypothetical protein
MPTVPPSDLPRSTIFTLFFIAMLASGCTSTIVTFHSVGMEPPLCSESAKGMKTVVYWGTAWRPDQKDIARRETIIAKGMEDFFRTAPCFSVQAITRTIEGRDVLILSDREILASVPPDIDRIHIIRFEELGPVLVIYLSPILWTSDLSIQVRVRTLNSRTGYLESKVTAHWRRGGPFNLRGTDGLAPDLTGLLQAVFFKKMQC